MSRRSALVTGASSGIGNAFAHRLARDNYDLILVARRRERLKALADELQKNYDVNARVIGADLSRLEDIARVADIIGSTDDLTMLVNNAGFGTEGYLAELPSDKQQDMILVHCLATSCLTQAALPGMIERRSGAVINVSSIAGFMQNPGRANYGATKAYLITFSRAVQNEVQEHGIRVQALCPGFTYTEFHDTDQFQKFERSRVPQWMWMTAEEVVDRSLKALTRGKTVYIPGWFNKSIAAAFRTPGLRTLMMRYAVARNR